MNSSAVLAAEYIPMPGGLSAQRKSEDAPRKWKGIGIMYVHETKGAIDVIEFRVLYESQVSEEVKAAIAERFGAGALEWKVCP
jgi:hypothetical protein